MAPDDRKLINTFEARLRSLLLKMEKMQEEADELYAMIDERDKQIKKLEDKNKELQERYNTLMTARMLSVNDDDSRRAKTRLSNLIHEVDLCIAQLKAQD